MNQIAHKKAIDENDLSNSSRQESEALEGLDESSSSNQKENKTGRSSRSIYQPDLMDSSITGSVLNNSVGSGDNDYLFGGRMLKTLHWSIPWSDLMMAMFILFAVMYVYQASIKEIPSPENISAQVDPLVNIDKTLPEPEEDSMQNIYDLSRETLNMDKLRSVSSVELIPDKAVRIILTGDLLFDLGKANLREEAKMSLREIAAILRQTPYMVNLVGHTDDLPINTEQFHSNWELSTTRACQVARFLIEEMNIPAEKLFISGHASYQPIKHNDGALDRAANRRVEIIITKERPYAVMQAMELNEARAKSLHRGWF